MVAEVQPLRCMDGYPASIIQHRVILTINGERVVNMQHAAKLVSGGLRSGCTDMWQLQGCSWRLQLHADSDFSCTHLDIAGQGQAATRCAIALHRG